jgi:transposase-like protein
MEAGENVSDLARQLGVSRKSIYQWRNRYRLGGSKALRGRGRMTNADLSAHEERPAAMAHVDHEAEFPRSIPPDAISQQLEQSRDRPPIAQLAQRVSIRLG